MPLPESGRLIYLADLRPDHVAFTQDHSGAEEACVALAILEYPGVEWDVTESQMTALIEQFTSAPEGTDAVALGTGRPVLAHCVLELDSRGEVIDDWHPGNLDACKSFLDAYQGAVWESLPTDREQAASHVRERVANPHRGQPTHRARPEP